MLLKSAVAPRFISILFIAIIVSACSYDSESNYLLDENSSFMENDDADDADGVKVDRFEHIDLSLLNPSDLEHIKSAQIGYLDKYSRAFEILSSFLISGYTLFNERRFVEAVDIFYPSEVRKDFREIIISIAHQTPENVITFSNYQIHTVRRTTENLFIVNYRITTYDFSMGVYIEMDYKRYILLTDDDRLFLIDTPNRDIPYNYREGLTDYDLIYGVGMMSYRYIY